MFYNQCRSHRKWNMIIIPVGLWHLLNVKKVGTRVSEIIFCVYLLCPSVRPLYQLEEKHHQMRAYILLIKVIAVRHLQIRVAFCQVDSITAMRHLVRGFPLSKTLVSRFFHYTDVHHFNLSLVWTLHGRHHSSRHPTAQIQPPERCSLLSLQSLLLGLCSDPKRTWDIQRHTNAT